MSDTGTRVLGYGRQSQQRPGEDPNSSLSLNGQEDRFKAECAARGWVNLGFLRDHDLKGEDPTRPGMAELKARCGRGDVDAVWIVSLSRFSNDYIWQGLMYRELQRLGVKHLISVVEGVVDDEFMLGIHGLFSGKRIREMRVHLRNAFARRARDGGFPQGPAPMGFKRPHRITVLRANGTSYERETGSPNIDEAGASVVRDIFDRFDRGDSLHAIADDLARQGSGPRGGTWTRRTVKKILQSPIYAGDIAHKGIVVAHNDDWQIIPRDQWDRVHAKMKRLPVIRREQPASWLDGYVYHACGAKMYYQDYTGHSAGHGGMFVCRWENELPSTRCQLDRRIMGKALLEKVAHACLIKDFASQRTLPLALRWSQERAGGAQALKRRKEIEAALSKAQERWKRNHERFSDGNLKPAVMDEEDAKLKAAEEKYAADIAALPKLQPESAIAASSDAVTLYAPLVEQMNCDELRALLAGIGTVMVSEAGVCITYDERFAAVLPSTVIRVPKGGRGWRAVD